MHITNFPIYFILRKKLDDKKKSEQHSKRFTSYALYHYTDYYSIRSFYKPENHK